MTAFLEKTARDIDGKIDDNTSPRYRYLCANKDTGNEGDKRSASVYRLAELTEEKPEHFVTHRQCVGQNAVPASSLSRSILHIHAAQKMQKTKALIMILIRAVLVLNDPVTS